MAVENDASEGQAALKLDLIPGVEVAGAAAFLYFAADADIHCLSEWVIGWR